MFLVYYPIISYQKIKVYKVETMNMGNILLTIWCQCSIKVKPHQ